MIANNSYFCLKVTYFCYKAGCIPSFSCQEYAESLAVPGDDAGPIRCTDRAEACRGLALAGEEEGLGG